MRRATWPGELLRGVTDPTSVTQVQPGGSPSSLERVEVIGSSFPFEATGKLYPAFDMMFLFASTSALL